MNRMTLYRAISSRLLILVLCALFLLPCVPIAYADGEGGSCGDNLSWSLNDGILTISGSGSMTDYSDGSAPWSSYRETIFQVELPQGLTHVGDMAFYQCSNLMSVLIPDTVETIGAFSFSDCTNLTLLTIGSSVHSIEEAAFQNCEKLKALDLPRSLISIGIKAFYRCEEITSLHIPSSVKAIGSAAFGFCTNLVSVNLQAPISVIPEFLFYGCRNLTNITLPDTAKAIKDLAFWGCDQLNAVYYNGTEHSVSDIENAMENNQAGGVTNPQVQQNTGSEMSSNVQKPTSSLTQSSSNGTVKQEQITAIQSENVTGSLKIESTQKEGGTVENTDVNVTITIENENSWDEARDIVDTLLNHVQNNAPSETITVDVYLKGSEDLDPDLLKDLSGKNIVISVITDKGHSWRVDCSRLDTEEIPENLNFGYILTDGTEELTAELGGTASFVLKFEESAKINSEVLIRLEPGLENQGATLFQRDKKDVSRIQATLVDRDGYAHFYLASVDKETEYYIGINVSSDMLTQTPIIPGNMLSEYGDIENFQPIQYEITGRKSSWNMGLGKVMAILAVVMVSTTGVVGFVVYFWNKQRLKNGYIPQWDDEEE